MFRKWAGISAGNIPEKFDAEIRSRSNYSRQKEKLVVNFSLYCTLALGQ
jgi:hypothetical protein